MMSESTLPGVLAAYSRQGFGAALTAQPPYALLIESYVKAQEVVTKQEKLDSERA